MAFSSLYNPAAAVDKCTLFSDRNLINRRNVKQDVTAAANACRRFFILAVEARIIAAALHILEMNSIDDKEPKCHKFPSLPVASSEEKSLT